jgi:hypothetical protein
MELEPARQESKETSPPTQMSCGASGWETMIMGLQVNFGGGNIFLDVMSPDFLLPCSFCVEKKTRLSLLLLQI